MSSSRCRSRAPLSTTQCSRWCRRCSLRWPITFCTAACYALCLLVSSVTRPALFLVVGVARFVREQVAVPLALQRPLGEVSTPARLEFERQPGVHYIVCCALLLLSLLTISVKIYSSAMNVSWTNYHAPKGLKKLQSAAIPSSPFSQTRLIGHCMSNL